MNQQVTTGIVLRRVDYGEADRIITVLTPDQGKLSLIAKGVRRVKSKLAGGIELFSVTDLTFIRGRGDIGTVVSTRLLRHYGQIVKDLDRTMLGYDMISQLNKATEDETEPDYFGLLEHTFAALDDASISLDVIRLWFGARLLKLSGHTPNLQTEPGGARLTPDQTYEFSFDDTAFIARDDGPYDADAIKFLRLAFEAPSPKNLNSVQGSGELAARVVALVTTMQRLYIHT